jgi:glycosyltransferase involved in cell wall biosynthesis
MLDATVPPKFSIITPSLNQAEYLESNIQSVLSQHYPNFEHIVIDGCSTDGTIEILKKYPHLIWSSEKDSGQSEALNKGFNKATGEIIGWLNADDLYCQEIFHSVAEKFDDKTVIVVFGDGFEIDNHGKNIRTITAKGNFPEDLIKYWKWQYEFIQPSFFFRRKVFENIGYLDESLYYAMDFDFFIRLSTQYKTYHLTKPLACFRVHSHSKTGEISRDTLPKFIWEMHHVSKRYWGSPFKPKYYVYLASFIWALIWSMFKNLFFVSGSKSQIALKRLIKKVQNRSLNAS